LKKLVILAAILMLVLAASVPALAEVTQVPTQTYVSGTNTNTGGAVTTGGDPSGACALLDVFSTVGFC
jgi:phage baseplate assembly protein gpV